MTLIVSYLPYLGPTIPIIQLLEAKKSHQFLFQNKISRCASNRSEVEFKFILFHTREMKLLLTIFFAGILIAVCNATSSTTGQSGYWATSTYSCQTTTPSPGTGWRWCPEASINNFLFRKLTLLLGLWVQAPCDTIAAWINIGYTWQCRSGKVAIWQPYLRDVIEDSENTVGERTTYTQCPYNDGSGRHVCCPSPKTCHNGDTYLTICY